MFYSNNTGFKEGLDILGVSPDELNEYLNPKDDVNIYERICNLIESDDLNPDELVEIYYTIKDKIFDFQNILKKQMERENQNDKEFRLEEYYKNNNPIVKKYDNYLSNNKKEIISGNLNNIKNNK